MYIHACACKFWPYFRSLKPHRFVTITCNSTKICIVASWNITAGPGNSSRLLGPPPTLICVSHDFSNLLLMQKTSKYNWLLVMCFFTES